MRMLQNHLTGYDPSLSRMKLPPLVVGGLVAGGSAILDRLLKPKSSNSTNMHTTGTSTSMPQFDPRANPLLQTLLNRTGSNFNRGTFLPQGFRTNAIEQINQAGQGAETSLNASLAARGLGTSPVAAAALGGLQQQRQAQIGDLGVQLPMIERQMQQEDLANLLQTLGLFRGQTTSSDSWQRGTGTATQSDPGGGIGTLLGQMYANGAFQGGGQAPMTMPPSSYFAGAGYPSGRK